MFPAPWPRFLRVSGRPGIGYGTTFLYHVLHMARNALSARGMCKLCTFKETLTYLLYGPGDFIQRLHDILYDSGKKLGYFGRFCALELYGTIKPAECPPMNGRMAKALRYPRPSQSPLSPSSRTSAFAASASSLT